MRRFCSGLFSFVFGMTVTALAQTGQWTTFGHDPQRSGFAVDEHTFSPANVSGLGLEWKTILPNRPLSMNGLTAPLVVRDVKTEQGRRNLVIVAGSSDAVWALDAETGAPVWSVDFKLRQPRPKGGNWLCPNALNATPVIDPDKARLFVISSDGVLHSLNLADGRQAQPPTQFVPAYSKMWSLNYVGGVLYTSISQGCARVPSGVAAIDPDQSGRPVTRFYTDGNGAGVWGRGGVSAGFDGFIYGITGDGPFDPPANEFGDTLLRLAPRTLELGGYYTPADWEYLTRRDLDMGTSTPVVFRLGAHVYTAVGGKEGAIYVTDTSSMSGSDHHSTAYVSPRYTNAQQTFERNGIWGAMSTFRDSKGRQWLYVPSWGEPAKEAQFPISYGAVKDGSLMAFNVSERPDHKIALIPAWISENIAVPDPAAIAGGVIFVLGTGEDTMQVNNGDIHQLLSGRESRAMGHAILYALDAATGKQLWSSGDAISGWTHFSGLAIGSGKIFVTTHDGATYAFGLRKPGSAPAKTTVVPGSTAPSAAEESSAAPASANLPACGETSALFTRRCAQCHGADGRGQEGMRTPDFTDAAWQGSRRDEELLQALRNGTVNGMPAFGSILDSQQIGALIHCVVRGFAAHSQGR